MKVVESLERRALLAASIAQLVADVTVKPYSSRPTPVVEVGPHAYTVEQLALSSDLSVTPPTASVLVQIDGDGSTRQVSLPITLATDAASLGAIAWGDHLVVAGTSGSTSGLWSVDPATGSAASLGAGAFGSVTVDHGRLYFVRNGNTLVEVASPGSTPTPTALPIASSNDPIQLLPNDGPLAITFEGLGYRYDRDAHTLTPITLSGATPTTSAGAASRLFFVSGGDVFVLAATSGSSVHVPCQVFATTSGQATVAQYLATTPSDGVFATTFADAVYVSNGAELDRIGFGGAPLQVVGQTIVNGSPQAIRQITSTPLGLLLVTADDRLWTYNPSVDAAPVPRATSIASIGITDAVGGTALRAIVVCGGSNALVSLDFDGTDAPSVLASATPATAATWLTHALGRSFMNGATRVYDTATGIAYSWDRDVELWQSDGTPAGTKLFADLQPGDYGTNIRAIARGANGLTYFTADYNDVATGFCFFGLYSTDGTASGTRRIVTDGSRSMPIDHIAVFDGLILLSNGSPYATQVIDPATGVNIIAGRANLPPNFTPDYVINGKFISSLGPQISSYDLRTGTTTTTSLPYTFNQFDSTVGKQRVGDRILFRANTSTSSTYDYYLTDGTTAGTIRYPSTLPAGETNVKLVGTVGGKVLLTSTVTSSGFPPTPESLKLWSVSGDGSPTVQLAKWPILGTTITLVAPPADSPTALAYFVAANLQGTTLYRTDFTSGGTVSLGPLSSAVSLTALAADAGLYVFDSGVLRFRPNGSTSSIALGSFVQLGGLVSFDGRIFFEAVSTVGSAAQLWSTDGTAWGTAVADASITPVGPVDNSGTLNAIRPVVTAEGLLFAAADPLYGEEPRLIAADHSLPSATKAYDRDAGAVRFRFDEAVSLDASDVVLTRQGDAVPIDPSRYDLVFDANLAAHVVPHPGVTLADGHYTLVLRASGISDPAGNRLAADINVAFDVLAGDVDGDGVVGFSDLLTLARHYGQTGQAFWQGNLDRSADGSVGFADLLVLARAYGHSLPALVDPVAAPAPVPGVRKREAATPASVVG